MDVMPAAVTPFDAQGAVDRAGIARLLAHFRAEGATGVVVGGTTGEGPSLTSFERRELVRTAVPLAHGLPVWLGIATPSLEEAVWLAREAHKAGVAGVLAMPPFFHRDLDPTPWLRAFLDRAPGDVLLYHFPRFAPSLLDVAAALADHPRLAGLKDSSGERANLTRFAAALPGKRLFVGDETLLAEAIALGWTGTISGAANVLCRELAGALTDENGESRGVKLELLLPRLREIRSTPQPMGHKRTLVERGVLERADVRLPLVG